MLFSFQYFAAANPLLLGYFYDKIQLNYKKGDTIWKKYW